MKTLKTREDVMKIKSMRAGGFTSKQIGETLGISRRTVQYWVKRMKESGIEAPTTVKVGKGNLIKL
jgi:biotin operon repressor